jgi:hypothetical protein
MKQKTVFIITTLNGAWHVMLAGYSLRVTLLPGVNVENSDTFGTSAAVFNSARGDAPMPYLCLISC